MLKILDNPEANVWGVSPDAAYLHADAIVWDNHGCLPMSLDRNAELLPQIEQYHQAGVTVASLNIGYGALDLAHHFDVIHQMRRFIENAPDKYQLLKSAQDVQDCKRAGKLGIAFDIEGAGVIDDLSQLETFYDLGVRWIGLAYNKTNKYAGGCHDEDEGLTREGHELVQEMTRLGMAVCLSHSGYRTARDVLELGLGPVIISHSNARQLHDHPRNVPDDIIKGCAKTGGVVGVNGLKLFLGEADLLDRIVEQIDYLAELVGAQHIGLGFDYVFDTEEMDSEKVEMDDTFPPGLGYEDPVVCFSAGETPRVTDALLRRGYSEADIRLILGENWMRIAREVWR